MTTQPQSPSPPPPVGRPRLSTGRKLLLGVLILAVAGVFGTIGFIYFVDSKIEKIPDEELPSLEAEISDNGIRNILIVGSDSREGLDDLENFGSFGGSRTDVIMVAHIVPGQGAQLLSLPRDLKMEIPGHDTNRINAAFVFGGPDLLVQTIQNNLDIPIHHYVEINFVGFQNVIDALGGISKTFDNPARDAKSGLDVDAGTIVMDGETALEYARSRNYQELMFDKATSKSSAFNLPSFATTFAEQIRADAGFSVNVMIDLGRAALSLSSSDIQTLTLPVKNSTEDGRAYVVPIEPNATNIIDAFLLGNPFPEN